MPKDVIVACDFSTKAETLAFLDGFTGDKPYVKIGMELFYGAGPSIVEEIKARGHQIFLDLKLHDIPNTVGRTMQGLAKLGVDMTNLHASGGSEMMKAAVKGLEAGASGQRPVLLAVTVLTSISEAMLNDELRIAGQVGAVVESWAANAQSSGLDGVVCSPLEAGLVKARCGAGFYTVTPGIRYPDPNRQDDQSRVTSPADAAKIGSDYIVVGRPVTAAADPAAAYQRVKADFLGG